MKKTQSKAFSNLVISIVLLVFEIWAYVQTLSFKVVKNAAVQPASFPQFMCLGMMVFTIVLLIQSVIKLMSMKEDDPLAAPAGSINFLKSKGALAALVVIALCIDGKQMDSVRLSQRLTELIDTGRRVVFVIGGSLGLSERVVSRAQMKLSFSPMTFPHQLARVMLLEQVYRAMKIGAGERYHK